MKNKKGMLVLGLCILLAAGAVVFLLCRNPSGFTGDRIKNPDAYLLDIEAMNGSDQHTMRLQSGDSLQIHFETVKGSLRLRVQAPDGENLYDGDGKQVQDFTLAIPETGVYTILTEARRGKGTIRIQRIEAVQESTPEDAWKTAFAREMQEKYGVIPQIYEELGGGFYRVYAEVGGEVIPIVTVNAATGEYQWE